MCSEYELYTQAKKVDEAIGFTIRDPKPNLDQFEFHVRIYGQAPIIIVDRDGNAKFEYAQFSLRPPGTPYSTFNARLADWDEKTDKPVRIVDKPTWKKPFVASRCLVPMTAFLEPIYSGAHAGKVMSFASPEATVLFAPGIYAECPNPKKPGEIYVGFALVVHTAMPFVLETGHHRSPVFLEPKSARAYLCDSMTAEERYELLLNDRFVPALTSAKSRDLAKAWEKRVSANVEAHNEELAFVKRFEKI
jgi:putative SOS response-associated peptidase YedK